MSDRYQTLTISTVSVASKANLDTNSTGLPSLFNIVKLKVVPSGGSYDCKIFKKDTFLAADLLAFWDNVSGDLFYPMDNTTPTAPIEAEEGPPIPYDDEDGTGELHIRITNLSSAARTYTITILYEEVPLMGSTGSVTIRASLIGGSAVGSSLELRSTSGVGTTDFIKFTVGNNGATEAVRIVDSGRVGIGIEIPLTKLHLLSSGTSVITGSSDVMGNACIEGPDVAMTSNSPVNLAIVSNSALGADLGGTLGLGAKYTGNSWAAMAMIKGAKENATSGNLAGYLALGTRLNDGGSNNTTERMRITSVGNVGIGTTAPGGGTTVGTNVVSIKNGTVPVGGVADQVSIFSKDVTASAELFALDEAGNTPQLSPHPSDFLNTLPVVDRVYPWAYRSSNPYLGKQIDVDLAGLAAEVERLSGKKFMFIKDLPPEERADWDVGQTAQWTLRNQEITFCKAAIQRLDDQITLEPDVEKRLELKKQRDALVVPTVYKKKRPPQWMVDRGVKTSIV